MPEVRVDEVRRFMEDSLRAVGAPESEAVAHAALLLHADVTGHFSHGLNRLEFYINDISSGLTDANAKPVILKESAATAWVDGANALGATVGNFCMDVAIRKAKECGIGWVVAKRSNHFGMAGWWALKAQLEGLIGLTFTNSSPILVPTRAKKGTLGTNPIAMFAPATGGDYIGVDMASTTVAMGKIEVQIHKKEPLPEGWAMGTDGKVTTDAQEAFKAGRLLPLGGLESTGGYKGYGLSAIGEVFCSGLSGSNCTHRVPKWSFTRQGDPMDLGQCYAAIDPNCFAPGFGERIADCLRTWRNLEPVDPELPVLAPGDKERINAEQTTKRGSIIYSESQIESCDTMARKIGIKPLKVV
ncbi:(2R)-3-sulfolactate dehydrogenase (NADP(+))-like [Achroia grisella]|uniref:(2R)-3-sulfolactate dehydrogenase (NADP(+))-like n=1 Tax=Achroia grisella TaxID=688607 RepID=UPI0027D2055D|nr:(2R)-3-sulfolactate dehydrogenase (NADP(+))-like [Achroia grisella]